MPADTDRRAGHQPSHLVAPHPIGGLRPGPSSPAHCANTLCRRNWFGFLKDHRRPIFEGRWACSAYCLRAVVDIAIRHESAAAALGPEHTHRIPLGLILQSRGWITQAQLQHALAMQRGVNGGRLGRWLVEECGVSEEHVLHGLALQWRCSVFSLDSFHCREMALVLPHEIVERSGLLPLRISHRGSLRLAFGDRPHPAAALAVQRMTGLEVTSGLLGHSDWKSARQALFACETVRCSLEHVRDRAVLSRRIASDIAGMQPRASRLVRVHQLYWLRMWLEDATIRRSQGAIPPSREDMLDRIYTLEKQPTA